MTTDSDHIRGKRASDDGDDFDQSDSKRQRLEELQSDVRILLASRNAGAVIGKKGDAIKRLREDYHCTISLPDSQGPERILNISGKASDICDILREIIPKFEKERDVGQEEIRMLVHQNLAGRIIGKQGVKVKELKEQSGAQIKVYTECCPESTERVVQMIGNADQIASCTGLILDLLSEAVQRGMSVPYNPEYADESFASEYGGFIDSRRRGRGFQGGNRGGGSFGGGAAGNDMMRRGGFGRGPAGGDMFGGAPGGFRGGFGMMGPGRGGGFGMGRGGGGMMGGNGAGRTQTSNVSIPKNVAGAILGPGGSRMKQIQMESNTQIKMEQANVEGNERVITIVGTPENIQYAQFLLQQAVKQHGALGRRPY